MSDFYDLISHPPDRKLFKHLSNVTKIVKSRLQSCSTTILDKNLLTTMEVTAQLHDIGKATPFFQQYITTTDTERRKELKNRPENRHSLTGALLALTEANKRNLGLKLAIFAFLAIRYHHSNLPDPVDAFAFSDSDYEILTKQINSIHYWEQIITEFNLHMNPNDIKDAPENLRRIVRKIRRKIKLNFFDRDDYFKFLYLYSLLIAADKIEAGIGVQPARINFSLDIIDLYRNAKNWNNLEQKGKINKIRNQIYRNALDKVTNKPGIYVLSAPTGMGKTVAALAVAFKIKKLVSKSARIIYALPFTSIIDQNYKVYSDVFKNAGYKMPIDNLLLKHHHLVDSSYKLSSDQNELEFPGKGQLLIEDWNAEVIITTFIQLFYSLVGNKNKMLKKFNRFPGSILIIDELQAIPIKYWGLISTLFNELTEKMNCSIIVSTATKPPLQLRKTIELVTKNADLYQKMGSRFKLQEKFGIKSIDQLAKAVINNYASGLSVLIIVNTIGASKVVYEKLKDEDINLVYLSSAIVPFERLNRINQINSLQHKVVISTQIVEAGVDIDLDVVYRDIAPLDSVIQSAGRCNRNMKKSTGVIKVIDLIDDKTNRSYATYIYDEVLLNQTKSLLQKRKELTENKLNILINEYFNDLRKKKRQDEDIASSLETLRFASLSDFRLIENELSNINCFIELNNDASLLWANFQNLDREQDVFKRKALFNQFKGSFLQYVISLNVTSIKRHLPDANSGLIYIKKDLLGYYYDKITGFKFEDDYNSIIF